MILGDVGKAGAHLNVLEAKHYAIAPSDMDEVRGSEARARCDVVDARVLEELEVAIEARKLRDVISSRAARPARNEARARRDAVDGTLRQGLRVAIFNALRLPIFVDLRLPIFIAIGQSFGFTLKSQDSQEHLWAPSTTMQKPVTTAL